MTILTSLDDLKFFLKDCSPNQGCLADTGFLYATSFDDDRCYDDANDVFDILSENQIPIYANVISRVEFIDLIFRKQITNACIELYKETKQTSSLLVKTLKNIRDQDTACQKTGAVL